MKRCPQCEFIYEDDQSLCDMDGVLLVFDSRTLPNLHALATVSGPLPEKGARRSRMVPAFATLLLLAALGSVYYVSMMRNPAASNFSPPSATSTTAEAPAAAEPGAIAPAPAPVEDPNQIQVPAAEPSPETKEEPAAEEPRETHAAPAVTKPAATATGKSTTSKTSATKPEPKKDDSKVESILKKTGKILKKPFKF